MFAPMLANTVDFRTGEGYGTPWQREPMIKMTYKQKIDSGNELSYALAVVDPQQDGDNSAIMATGTGTGLGSNWNTYDALGINQAAVNTNLPNLEAQIALKSNSLGVAPSYAGAMKGLNVTLFGMYGHARYNFAPTASTYGEDSYGYGLYSFVPIISSADGKSRANTLSFEGQIYQASNLVWNGATAQTFTQTGSIIYTNNSPGGLTAGNIMPMKDLGVALQLIYYPTHKLGLTAGYLARTNDNKANDFLAVGTSPGPITYDKQDQMVYANAAYDINTAVRVSAEYQNVITTYGNQAYAAGGGAGASVGGSQTKGVDNIGRLSFYYFF